MDKTQNFVVGLVKTAPSPATSGTSLVIDQSYADYFPDPSTFGAYNLVIWNRTGLRTHANCEVVRVTAKTDTSDGAWTTGEDAKLTITRAQEGSTALSVEADFLIYMSGTGKLFDDIETALGTKEVASNKVTSISGSSTDAQYPSAKLVYDQLATKASLTGTETLTNKRINPRIVTAESYTTDTGTSLNCDTTDMFIVTAQAGALKFNNPSGTPVDGQKLWLAVTGTAARALTYDTQFESSANVTLPTTTVTTARIDIGLVWVAATSKWRCVAVS